MKSKLSEQNVNSDNKQWIIYHIIATKTNVIHLWLNIDKIIKTLGNCDARIILACFTEKSIFMNRVIKCSILFKIVTRSTYSNRHQGKIVNANAMEMQLIESIVSSIFTSIGENCNYYTISKFYDTSFNKIAYRFNFTSFTMTHSLIESHSFNFV